MEVVVSEGCGSVQYEWYIKIVHVWYNYEIDPKLIWTDISTVNNKETRPCNLNIYYGMHYSNTKCYVIHSSELFTSLNDHITRSVWEYFSSSSTCFEMPLLPWLLVNTIAITKPVTFYDFKYKTYREYTEILLQIKASKLKIL